MDRRTFLGALAGGLVAQPLAAQALQTPKLYRVGWVFLTSTGEELRSLVDAFRDGLRQHGYVEGQNLAFEFRWSDGRADRVDELTGELVKLGVDVVVAGPSQNAHAAQRATTTIPILLVGADPLNVGRKSCQPTRLDASRAAALAGPHWATAPLFIEPDRWDHRHPGEPRPWIVYAHP